MSHFYDAHNHLQDDRFVGHLDELIAAARAAGVARMVVNGATVDDWPLVAELATRFPDIVQPSFGLHPWYVHEQPANWEATLCEWLRRFPNAGVGEIGLDRWKPDLPWDGQQEIFTAQLRIAAELNRPASIHCLQAWGPMLNALENTPRPARGFLLHSYGGSIEMIPRFAQLGAYFSLPGYYAHERKARQRETFRHIPADRLLIETDAPDQPLPADRIAYPLTTRDGAAINHPANIAAVYAFAAELLNQPLTELAAQIETNFTRLFG